MNAMVGLLSCARRLAKPLSMRIAAVLAAASLCACASQPNGQISLALPQAAATSAPLQTPAQREHQRIVATYGGQYDDAALEAMVTATVDRLVAASERPDLKYKVVILNSATINAFALPNGQLYVTRGLIALANDSSELGSVLAHEMAHVIAQHAQIRENQARQTAMLQTIANEVLGDPDLGALALAKSKLALASFSRAQEFEADGIGIGIAGRAGYDPYGAVRFLSGMQRNAELKAPGGDSDPRSGDFLATHPATPERVQNAQANARTFASPGTGKRDREEYLAKLDGLVYGEDPSEGFVRGRRFVHPKLGFTFTAPPNFTLDNTNQAVLGIKEGGAQALRLDVVQVPAEQPLTDYLNSGWMDNVDAKSIEKLTISGFPAAAASATGKEWSFRLYALRFGTDVYRFIFAAKQRSRDTDRLFRESVTSFRRMSTKEASEVKPLRLQIVTVGPQDTVDIMSRRMATADKKRERFLVLNGLQAGEQLAPGTQVKLVVE
jgi:predicted Zn-dependent protease